MFEIMFAEKVKWAVINELRAYVYAASNKLFERLSASCFGIQRRVGKAILSVEKDYTNITIISDKG